MTRLEELYGLSGAEPDTVVARSVPRGDTPCGRDALGSILVEGEPMVCLCCGTTGTAHVLTEEDRAMDGGFDYQGSSWVRVAPWLQKLLPPEHKRRKIVYTERFVNSIDDIFGSVRLPGQ